MTDTGKISIKSALASLLLLCSMSAPIAQADNYLDALEAEAKDMSDAPAETEQSNWKPSDSGITDNLSPNLNKAGFEENLKHNFVGSYTFYSRLSDKDKETVFSAYQNNNNIQELSALIKELHKNSIEE